VLIGAVIFRAPTIGSALSLLGGMIGLHGLGLSTSLDGSILRHAALDMTWLASLYAIVWWAPTTQEIMDRTKGACIAWQPTLPWAVACGCAATLGLLSIGGTGEFVYFRF
jgi:hypothetical protein